MNLSIDKFDDFLELIFPDLELDKYGRLVENDEFQVIRMFAISNVNIMQFGLFLIRSFNFNLHLTAYFSKLDGNFLFY